MATVPPPASSETPGDDFAAGCGDVATRELEPAGRKPATAHGFAMQKRVVHMPENGNFACKRA